MEMRTVTINPENWIDDEIDIQVSEDGTHFKLYDSYLFEIKARYYEDTGEEYRRVANKDAADMVEYDVLSADGSWDREYPMCTGIYWPSVYQHEDVEMFESVGEYTRRAKEPWEAAAKVLSNLI